MSAGAGADADADPDADAEVGGDTAEGVTVDREATGAASVLPHAGRKKASSHVLRGTIPQYS
jgi:hypothetical protein